MRNPHSEFIFRLFQAQQMTPAQKKEQEERITLAKDQLFHHGITGLDLFNHQQRIKKLQCDFTEEMFVYLVKSYKPYFYQTEYYWSWLWQRALAQKVALLTCGNQAGKSTSNIKLILRLAVNEDNNWHKIWPHVTVPNIMWYFYPEKKVFDVEYEKKWVDLISKETTCPKIGYKIKRADGAISEIKFNSGVSIYFKSYSQREMNLQSATVYLICIDEEPPFSIWAELLSRTMNCGGLIRGVFTPTIGQPEFARAFDPKARDRDENFKDALTLTISLYDCQYYTKIKWKNPKYKDSAPLLSLPNPVVVNKDGKGLLGRREHSPQHDTGYIYGANGDILYSFDLKHKKARWDNKRIDAYKNLLGDEKEIETRIYGLFRRETGLLYPSYSRQRNNIEGVIIPRTWSYYCGVDIGSGGPRNHPAAIVFVALSEDHRQGLLIDCWRGDKIVTSNSYIFNKFLELRGPWLDYFGKKPDIQIYDSASIDFKLVALEGGEVFKEAKKIKKDGSEFLDTLLSIGALQLLMSNSKHEPHRYMPLVMEEFESVPIEKKEANAKQIKDDLLDALRYCVFLMPWNLDYIAKQRNLQDDYQKELKKSTEPPYENKILKTYLQGDHRELANTILDIRRKMVRAKNNPEVQKLIDPLIERQIDETKSYIIKNSSQLKKMRATKIDKNQVAHINLIKNLKKPAREYTSAYYP